MSDRTIDIVIRLHENGALEIKGPIHEKELCLAMLANAKDAIRGHRGPRELVVPAKDVQVA